MRTINKLIIHCSASDKEAHDDVEVIRDWHMNGNHWSDIGYHFFIKNNGQLQMGRSVNRIGAHVKGHNSDSIGICLSGLNKFSTKQIDTAVTLVNGLMYLLELDKSKVFGHYEFTDKKTCPNIDMDWFRSRLN